MIGQQQRYEINVYCMTKDKQRTFGSQLHHPNSPDLKCLTCGPVCRFCNRGLAFPGNSLSTPLNFVVLGLCLMQYVLRKQWAFTPNNLYKCAQLIKWFLNQISALHNIKGATLEASNNRNQFIQMHYPRKLERTFKSATSGSWGTRKTRRSRAMVACL